MGPKNQFINGGTWEPEKKQGKKKKQLLNYKAVYKGEITPFITRRAHLVYKYLTQHKWVTAGNRGYFTPISGVMGPYLIITGRGSELPFSYGTDGHQCFSRSLYTRSKDSLLKVG